MPQLKKIFVFGLLFMCASFLCTAQSNNANAWVPIYKTHVQKLKLSAQQQTQFDDILEFGKIYKSEKVPEDVMLKINEILTDAQRKKLSLALKAEESK